VAVWKFALKPYFEKQLRLSKTFLQNWTKKYDRLAYAAEWARNVPIHTEKENFIISHVRLKFSSKSNLFTRLKSQENLACGTEGTSVKHRARLDGCFMTVADCYGYVQPN
jgi:hypothetical protein